jgi:AmiR/NasT family two-component response regulator
LAARDQAIGALNLYSKRTNTFDDDSRSLGKLFASQASVAISNAQVYDAAIRLAEQLKKAVESREVIGEAKGILMAQEGVTDDEAFEMLKKLSQNQNVKLRDIAEKIVENAVRKPD